MAGLGRPTWVRLVLVPGLTDVPDNVEGVARFVAGLDNVDRVDVLPYHRMAAGKYRRLGPAFPLTGVLPPGQTLLERVHARFRAHGLTSI